MRLTAGLGDPLLTRAAGPGRHPSHRWNRFLNRIDPLLLLGGQELRLVSTGGRARGPHGLGLLRRPPACPAEPFGRVGSEWARPGVGTGLGPDRAAGGGREAASTAPTPPASRLPPPRLLRPAPEHGSAPAGSVRLRAPAVAGASARLSANRHPERRGGYPAIHSRWARAAGRGLAGEGRGEGKGRSAGTRHPSVRDKLEKRPREGEKW